MAMAGSSRFGSHDESLLTSGFFSDVKVQCGAQTWKLHKVILSSRCAWFNKALNGKFKEAETGIVKINDFKAEEIEWLCKFIYTGVLPIKDDNKQDIFTGPIKLYEIGDYFLVPELCEDALARLKKELDTAAGTLQKAKLQPNKSYYGTDQHWNTVLVRNDATRLSNEYYKAVRVVYKHECLSNNDALRRELISFFSKTGLYHVSNHGKELDILTEVPRFAMEILTRCGGFAIDLSKLGYPANCTKCQQRPLDTGGHFEKVQLEDIENSRVRAYCKNCAPTTT
ncbi:hypothetical protein F4779DRAFT_619991 [Xylariaceae sp. FL0662B]|nr:hypothetical protein F4779DRAFT_619991 [Xylariaceae sp. FL0662B]